MALIEWRSEFETGIGPVDYEHRELIDALNRLGRMLSGETGTDVALLLAALHDRIAAHFALEERIMRDGGYGGYAPHKAEHERLLDEIRDLMEEERAGGFRDAPARLSHRLEEWFCGHFHAMDVPAHHAEAAER